ncbi:(2Fe-2S) ferredoxin domain-containing protein [Streptomyces dangxiongensis]|uniref:(2Fe-2S) ferredoxin domain-containing protein n=1 Tax=Streptomyces dangxiongensis TaxID=1442032 RepID=A0A3G2J7A9_9ACTN|nr:(2Fe-2S) ferredoxin domain-containing protein [Streptomyces dangxiongensis]AYN38130.1 (2Fe-2S) ferredoxin domain-containing protein [Streptomyces dangxiongensis]
MSKRSRRAAPAPAAGAGAARPTVTVCRGCCCGTPKVPGLDHTAQLRGLREALDGTATVRVTDCLDACERANVIVVQPSPAGRRAGGRPVWLGLVNDPDATADIATWIEGGGPGLTEPPGILDLYAFSPSRRVRAELDE